jgi:hypothetical protein
MEGPAAVDGVAVERGGALFIPAAVGDYQLAGASPVYRCRPGAVTAT